MAQWKPMEGGIFFVLSGEIQRLTAHKISDVPLPDGYTVCRLVDVSDAQPLDMPDGPGFWAFEGQWNVSGALHFKRVWQVITVGGNLLIIGNDGLLPLNKVVGKWYRLTMPWDSPQPQPAIPDEVRSTLRELLEKTIAKHFGWQSAVDETTKPYRVALTWLDSLPAQNGVE